METRKVAAASRSTSGPLVVDRLTKIYPTKAHAPGSDGTGVTAVAGISFDVNEGEVFGLLGPNGAGKTTTLGILTTLVRPTSGRAIVDGHDVATNPVAVRRAIGV